MRLSPFCFLHGIKFQKVAKKNWDEPVDENVRKDWAKWVNDLSTVKFITLPKCYFKGQIEILNSTLHVFTDVSVLAFVAIIYLVIQTVTSKTRVAPLMDFSLPRLELLGALTGARLINCVHEALTEVLYAGFPLFYSYIFPGLFKDFSRMKFRFSRTIFWIYRAEGTICNDHWSLSHAAGGAVSPPAGPGQGPGGGPGGKAP